MAGFFQSVYDWLLRLFWCVCSAHPCLVWHRHSLRVVASGDRLRSKFVIRLTKDRAAEMEVTMIGLQNAGKTSLLRVLAGGDFTIDSIPTVGFNMKKLQKGHVTLKCWDLGGQPRFRSMWERYSRNVNAIVYIVDAADKDAVPVASEELHALLDKPSLQKIPLLVLGNKSDLPDKLSVDELIQAMDLKAFKSREVSCYMISAKEQTNLDAVLEWLIARKK